MEPAAGLRWLASEEEGFWVSFIGAEQPRLKRGKHLQSISFNRYEPVDGYCSLRVVAAVVESISSSRLWELSRKQLIAL